MSGSEVELILGLRMRQDLTPFEATLSWRIEAGIEDAQPSGNGQQHAVGELPRAVDQSYRK